MFYFHLGIDWQVKVSSRGSRYNTSLANLLLLRGKESASAETTSFLDSALYAPWVPTDGALMTGVQPRAFNHYEKSASLISNSQSPVGVMDIMVGRAWDMFSSRAYVHQYAKHGLTEDEFLDSFAVLEQVIANYKHL
jgi:tubulin delta